MGYYPPRKRDLTLISRFWKRQHPNPSHRNHERFRSRPSGDRLINRTIRPKKDMLNGIMVPLRWPYWARHCAKIPRFFALPPSRK